jgi:hypothetical protein
MLTCFFWNHLSPVLEVHIFIFYFVYSINFGFVVYPLGASWNELKTKILQVFRIVKLWGTDKSLARPGRKEATETKL